MELLSSFFCLLLTVALVSGNHPTDFRERSTTDFRERSRKPEDDRKALALAQRERESRADVGSEAECLERGFAPNYDSDLEQCSPILKVFDFSLD